MKHDATTSKDDMPKYKVSNDFVQLTMTCTINKYTIDNLTRKSDNTPFKVCNVSAYIIVGGKIENIKIVIYNIKTIDLFEKYPQANKRVLISCRLSFRTYEKDGIKHRITEYIIGDSDTLQIIGSRKTPDNRDNSINTENTSMNINNNLGAEGSYSAKMYDDALGDFDLDQFLQEDK